MKKKISSIIIIIIALVIVDKIYLVYRDYNISDNVTEIKQGIEKWMKRGRDTDSNLKINIKEAINIDNKKYVVFTIKGKMGKAELIKGINNKYKVLGTGYGDNLYRPEIIETNKEKYILVACKNYNFKSHYVKVILNEYDENVCTAIKKSTEHILKIPKEDYYIVYKNIPDNVNISRAYLEIKLLDKEKKDITSEMLDLHNEYRNNL